MAQSLDRQKKILESKMLLDTFEIPKRPRVLSPHQYKKRHGSNQGYAAYKAEVKKQGKDWDKLYKSVQKVERMKTKFLSEVDLSDEALLQAQQEAQRDGLSVPDILSRWIERGRHSE